MALATVRAIIAAAAVLTAQSSCASDAGSTQVSCSIGKGNVVQKITTPGTSLKVFCKDNSDLPSNTAPKVCVESSCKATSGEPLKVPCPGGNTPEMREHSLTVNCPQLPNAEATVFLLCGSIVSQRNDNACIIELQVSPPPPEGPQICAAAGSTTTLAIHGETGQTQFACGSNLTALHPSEAGKVFKENCTSEEDLKDLKLTTGNPYNTLAATEKPRTRKLCYVCRKGTGARTNGECKIIIDVSAGSKRFERTALGLASSIVLTVLQLR